VRHFRKHIWLDKLFLDDGTAVSHWFVSHHDADDLGSVLFEFPGGQTLLVDGWRCCGIEIEDMMRPLNKETFVHAIKELQRARAAMGACPALC
jgi:hypothetical protein